MTTASATPDSSLPLRIEDITADWLTTILSERYPDTVVTEVHVGTVIAGTATKVRLLLAYNDAGHRHRLPATMWLKGGFIRHQLQLVVGNTDKQVPHKSVNLGLDEYK